MLNLHRNATSYFWADRSLRGDVLTHPAAVDPCPSKQLGARNPRALRPYPRTFCYHYPQSQPYCLQHYWRKRIFRRTHGKLYPNPLASSYVQLKISFTVEFVLQKLKSRARSHQDLVRYQKTSPRLRLASMTKEATRFEWNTSEFCLSHWCNWLLQSKALNELVVVTNTNSVPTHTQTWSADAMMTSRALILVSIDLFLYVKLYCLPLHGSCKRGSLRVVIHLLSF